MIFEFVLRIMGSACAKECVIINKDKYYVKERLGEGGFSYVDLVQHSKDRKLYALKRLSCHSKSDQAKALEEVNYMKMFQHSNIISHCDSEVISLHDHSSSVVSKVLILMPLYKGGTLQDRIDMNQAIPQARLLRILKDVCAGLKAMHTHEPPLAHRDIKPANILLSDDGTAVIMDLGSMSQAVHEPQSTKEAQTLQDEAAERCTMPYRAPELFQIQTGDRISQASDIWSLGCLLYACIYMKGPFDDIYQKGGSIALAAVGGNVQYPEQNRYSGELLNLVKTMMVVDPQLRPDIDNVIETIDSIENTAENRV